MVNESLCLTFSPTLSLQAAEMKQLVHTQELSLLRDFDKREVLLVQKRQVKIDDKNDILDKIGERDSVEH